MPSMVNGNDDRGAMAIFRRYQLICGFIRSDTDGGLALGNWIAGSTAYRKYDECAYPTNSSGDHDPSSPCVLQHSDSTIMLGAQLPNLLPFAVGHFS
jgi:hypothetical protein